MPNASTDLEVLGGAEDSRYGMYIGDSRHLADILSQQFPERSGGDLIDVTITSPPYADKKNYEANEELQIGLGQEYDEYLEELRSVYKQVYDYTKETGTLWVVVNTIKKDQRMVNIPFDIADVCENLEGIERCKECDDRLVKDRETGKFYCEQCGWDYNAPEDSWRLQEVVIWDKERTRPWSRQGQFRNVFEYILCFSKSNDFKFNLDNIRIADPDEFKKWWVELSRAVQSPDSIRALEDASVRFVIPSPKNKRVKREIGRMKQDIEVKEDYAIYGAVSGGGTNERAAANLVLMPSTADTEKTVAFMTNKDVKAGTETERKYTKSVIDRYSRRWGIENSYKTIKDFLAWTTPRTTPSGCSTSGSPSCSTTCGCWSISSSSSASISSTATNPA